MKLRAIIRLAMSNLTRNKGRTLLTIGAIFIGSFTIALTTGVRIGVNNYITQQINSVGGSNQLMITAKNETAAGAMTEQTPQKYDAEQTVQLSELFQQLTDADVKKIREIEGIAQAEAMKNVSTDFISGKNGEKYVFSAEAAQQSEALELEAGKSVNQATEEFQVILEPSMVEALGYGSANEAIGQKVTIGATATATQAQEEVEATIVGVRTTSLLQANMSIINQALVNKIFAINEEGMPEGLKNQYMTILATASEGSTKAQINTLKGKLDQAGYEAITVEEQIGMFRSVINAITAVLTMFGAIALFAASFGIVNTLYMSVQERTREIGLMKAVGLGNGKVFFIFSLEAALIGFFGSLLGILGAMGIGFLINLQASNSFLEGLTGFRLIQFSIPSVLLIIFTIMLLAFIAGALPANRAAKLNPIESLRYE